VLVTAEGDSGTSFTDKITDDGVQTINALSGGPTAEPTFVLSGSQSARFDTAGERLEFVGSAAGLGTQFTLGAFVDVSTTGNMRIFSNFSGGGGVQANDLIWDNIPSLNRMRFFLDGVEGQFPLVDFASAGPTHIAATVDGNQVKVFIEGVQHGTTQTVGDGTFSLGPDIIFGEDTGPGSVTNEAFLGEADEIFMVNRLLTAEEIEFIANNSFSALLAIPEPSSGMLLGLGSLFLIRRGKKRPARALVNTR